MDTKPKTAATTSEKNRAWKPILLTMVIACYFLTAGWWVNEFAGMIISREPTIAAGAQNFHQLRSFWIGSGLMWVCLTALYFIIRKNEHSFSTIQFVGTTTLILLAALVIRSAVVITHQPGLSDDIWRYLFDGETLISGNNPYETAPNEVDLQHERFTGEYALANRVNNPELTTIYLPVSQIVFALSAELDHWTSGGRAHTSINPQREATVFRFVFIAFEFATMLLLALMLYTMKQSAWYLALYAWHPLALTEIAGEGHQDIIGIFFMVAALTLWQWHRRKAKQGTGSWSALLALSALVKPLSIPLAAFQLRYDRAKWSDWARSLGVGVVLCLLLLIPFSLVPHTTAWTHFSATVDRFVHSWAFFGSLYIPLLTLTGSEEWVRRILALILAAFVLLMIVKRTDPWKAGRNLFFAAVLLSTTAWPWYLLWALVLIPLRPGAALWIATLTIPWGYAILGDVVGWTVPTWLLWLSYAPVYGVLLIELYYYLQRNHNRAATDG